MPTSDGAATQAMSKAGGAGVAGGGGMMGGGGMAPGAGAGRAGADGSGHNAATFLHTSDQGDEIVGDLGNVAPPVIGEVDPHDSPDIELRI